MYILYINRSGVEHGNLRELALARMKDLNLQCRDVRTREVGIQEIHNKIRPYEVCGHYLYNFNLFYYYICFHNYDNDLD